MTWHHTDAAVAAVAALGDPLRRDLYRFVIGQDHAVGRDEAAEAAGVTRSAAAFHLDRLVADGLLEAEFRRLSGRRGPGAGRPAKLYRRAAGDIAVSLPARRYQLAAGILAAAVSEAASTAAPVTEVLDRVARQRGAELARDVAPRSGGDAPAAEWAGAAVEALAGEGYEPRQGAGHVALANCPFSGLVAEHAELVCRMNLSLLDGFTGALPAAGMTAQLRPSEEACCVRLVPIP